MLERLASVFEREAGHVVMGLAFAIFGACFAVWVDKSTGTNMAWAGASWMARSMGTTAAQTPKITA